MGSEDGNIFIWDIEKTSTNHYKEAKPKGYEFFNPFLISELDREQFNQKKAIANNRNVLDSKSELNEEENIYSQIKTQLAGHQLRQTVCNISQFVPKVSLNFLVNQQNRFLDCSYNLNQSQSNLNNSSDQKR